MWGPLSMMCHCWSDLIWPCSIRSNSVNFIRTEFVLLILKVLLCMNTYTSLYNILSRLYKHNNLLVHEVKMSKCAKDELLSTWETDTFRCRDSIDDFNRPRAFPTRFSGTRLSCFLIAVDWWCWYSCDIALNDLLQYQLRPFFLPEFWMVVVNRF